jgi:hypothetical protein
MSSRVHLQIDRREPFAGGMAFGDVGPYERIAGRVRFAVDPDAPENAAVVDLRLAPRTAAGLVEFETDLFLLAPVDRARGNGALLYDVNNRGDKRAVQFFCDAAHSNDPATADHAGNGFLMRRGYTVVWSGWQGDLLPGEGRLTMRLPSAPVTGLTRGEYVLDGPGVRCLPLSGNDYTYSYPTASLDPSRATLTRREYETDPREPVAPAAWSFARLDEHGRAVPSDGHIYLPEGFRPGWIYELVYQSRDPLVLGLGFTGVRDLVSFFRHGEQDADGVPNPLRAGTAGIERVYGWGRSQSGRFLRDLVYRGFNVDGAGRRVFDAIWPHVAGGGRVWLNGRFAQPGRYPRHHLDHLFPSDQFPFAYAVTTDPLTGTTDGILTRPESDPLVLHTQTSSEYWARRGSLVHTDALGNDLDNGARVRVFLFAGSQHRALPGGGPEEGSHRFPSNPLDTAPVLRALLDALDGRLFVQDFGPRFAGEGIIDREPPVEDRAREYRVLVPAVDEDGNEFGGVRTPDILMPRATYTGWNYRPDGSSERAPASIIGSYFPFARDAAERAAAGDERPSLAERYRDHDSYVDGVRHAAARLVAERLLLEEDAERYVERAARAELPWRTAAEA